MEEVERVLVTLTIFTLKHCAKAPQCYLHRSGILPFVFEPGFSFASYVEYALDVPMYFVHSCSHADPNNRWSVMHAGHICICQPN